jgi:hypothetical protein
MCCYRLLDEARSDIQETRQPIVTLKVTLIGIAQQNDFGVFSNPTDKSLCLCPLEVLSLIDDEDSSPVRCSPLIAE